MLNYQSNLFYSAVYNCEYVIIKIFKVLNKKIYWITNKRCAKKQT